MGNNQKWTDFFTRFHSLLVFLKYVKQQQQHCNLGEEGGRREGKGSWQEQHTNTRFQQLTVKSQKIKASHQP